MRATHLREIMDLIDAHRAEMSVMRRQVEVNAIGSPRKFSKKERLRAEGRADVLELEAAWLSKIASFIGDMIEQVEREFEEVENEID